MFSDIILARKQCLIAENNLMLSLRANPNESHKITEITVFKPWQASLLRETLAGEKRGDTILGVEVIYILFGSL